MLNILFPLLTYPYITRTLGVEGVGIANIAITVATYFSALASLGIPVYGIREIARCKGDKKKLSYVISELLIINAIGVLVSFTVFLLMIYFFDFFYKDFYIHLLAGVNILLSLFQIDWFFQGTEKFKALATRNLIVKVFSLAFVYLLIKEKGDVTNFVFVSVLGLSLTNIINITSCLRIIKLEHKGLNLKRHLKPVLYFSGTRVVSTVYTVLDSVILGVMTSNYYVGLYSTVMKLVRILTTVIASSTMVFFADASRLANNDEYSSTLKDLLFFLSLICFPAAIYMCIYATELVVVFAGKDFIHGGVTLKILSLLVIISIGTNFLGMQILYPKNKEADVFKSLSIGATLCIISNLILIPAYKQNGAALSAVIAESGILIYQMIVVFRGKLSSLSGLSQRIKKATIIFIIFGISTLTLKYLCGSFSSLEIIIASFIVLPPFYLFLLWIFKETVFIKIIYGLIK